MEARVSNPDPAALTVTIDAFDGDALARDAWEVASWPRSGGAMPARGDRCLVVMSEIGRPWIVVGDWTGPPAWQPLVLTSNWITPLPRHFPPGYAKAPNGWVSLRGIVSHAGSVLQYEQLLREPLPAGCRPATNRSFHSTFNGEMARRIQVNPDGTVQTGEVPGTGLTRNGFWTLDDIGYWAEA
jgi:hypothetical protein